MKVIIVRGVSMEMGYYLGQTAVHTKANSIIIIYTATEHILGTMEGNSKERIIIM